MQLPDCYIKSEVSSNGFETKKRRNCNAAHYQNAACAGGGGAAKALYLAKPPQEEGASLAVPIKCIHILGDEGCSVRKLQRKNAEETVVTHLSREKRYKVPAETISFFKNHENVL